MRNTAFPLFVTTLFCLLFNLGAEQNGFYPVIPLLEATDPVFKQYSDDVQEARIALASASQNLPLHIYVYIVRPSDTLLGIAARCSIPYDSIASLNRLESIQESLVGKLLYLPTLPGLYLSEQSSNQLEALLISTNRAESTRHFSFTLRNPPRSQTESRLIHCLPDTLFDGTSRTFFLSPGYRLPVTQSRLTSNFGMRKNPLTGNQVFHKGIDLAAPRGTPVVACASGTVTSTGSDPIYGNFIIISHAGTRESLYGHLESIKIKLHDQIKSGSIIGTVGSTGQSTGPHLHFEIHENGIPKNPAGLIKGY